MLGWYLIGLCFCMIFFVIYAGLTHNSMVYVSEYTYTKRNVSAEERASWRVDMFHLFICVLVYPLGLIFLLGMGITKVIMWIAEQYRLASDYRKIQ